MTTIKADELFLVSGKQLLDLIARIESVQALIIEMQKNEPSENLKQAYRSKYDAPQPSASRE